MSKVYFYIFILGFPFKLLDDDSIVSVVSIDEISRLLDGAHIRR